MKKIILLIAAILTIAACVNLEKQQKKEIPFNVSPTGLKYISVRDGTGPKPQINQKVTVHFRMADAAGKIIEDTYLSKKSVTFKIGSDEIILKGLEEAVLMMNNGGLMKLIIPPDLGFGDRAIQRVPANTTLYMEVELLQIQN
jgi:FKBP-type peptidyl-prolyl cis-trans isomerase